MPLLQSTTDPIWDSSGFILFEKFGINPRLRELIPIRPPRAKELGEAYVTLPRLGEVFIFTGNRKRSSSPKFSVTSPDIGVVIGASETYVDDQSEDEREGLPRTARRVFQVRFYWLNAERTSNELQSLVGSGFRKPPVQLPIQTELSRFSHEGFGKRNSKVRKRLVYGGPPLLSFERLTQDSVRTLRHCMCECAEVVHAVRDGNLMSPPPERDSPVPADPFVNATGMTAAAQPYARPRILSGHRSTGRSRVITGQPASPEGEIDNTARVVAAAGGRVFEVDTETTTATDTAQHIVFNTTAYHNLVQQAQAANITNFWSDNDEEE